MPSSMTLQSLEALTPVDIPLLYCFTIADLAADLAADLVTDVADGLFMNFINLSVTSVIPSVANFGLWVEVMMPRVFLLNRLV